MAFAFNSTPGSATSNSNISVSDTDDYFFGHLEGSTWSALNTQKKQAALVQATNRLDMEIYGGRRTNVNSQRLAWPRSLIIDRDKDKNQESVAEFISGAYYRDPYNNPKEYQDATCEMALFYIKELNGEFTVDGNDLETLSKYKVGPLDVTIKPNIKADRLPTKVENLLKAIGPNAWDGSKPLIYAR